MIQELYLFLVLGGLLLSIFVGWVMKDPMGQVRPGAEGVRWFALWQVFLRFADFSKVVLEGERKEG